MEGASARRCETRQTSVSAGALVLTSEEMRMGEKEWNTEKGRWEIDGIPVTYKVVLA
jgi:hypothetical protein